MKTLFSLVVLVLVMGSGPLVRAESLKAGAAISNITPDIGAPVIGGFVPFPSTQIHDELNVRCLVLDDGSKKIALVVCDLLGIHRIVSEEARRLILERHGIPVANVMISGTHTHSAPSALGDDRLEPEQKPNEYQAFVIRRIVDGVSRAINNLRPAKLAFGSVDVPEHLFNRRWHMRPGTVPPNPFGQTDIVKMNPPAGSPNLMEPAGPIDPAISIIAVRDLQDRPISIFSAYSLHYVGGVGSGHISSDYFGYYCEHMRKLIEAEISVPQSEDVPPFVAMMANATSGDINNINFQNPRPARKPYEQIRYVAEDCAVKVLAATKTLEYNDTITLDARYSEPVITWRKPTPEQAKWAQETIAAGAKSDSDLSFIYAQRATKLAGYPESTTIPVQILRIGDVCIGTMPCEVFCEIGLEFREKCPSKHAFMVELAHGYFGYLPTPRHMQLGGYETWIGTNRLEPTASEKLLAELLKLAESSGEKP
jgi:neutral ceramidase